MSQPFQTGFLSELDEPTRRAFLDVHRRIAQLESAVGGGVVALTGRWQWNINAGAVPGGAQITTDTGVASTSTWIRFADHDKANFDWTAIIMDLVSGNRIVVQQLMNSNNRATYEVTGAPSDLGTYLQVPVSFSGGVGDGSGAWQEIVVGFFL